MKLAEAQEKFIQAWGVLGSDWGISRTMAQVHALLLISPKSLTTEDIMAQLQISRGNASMTVRDLIDWGLVRKEVKAGERKEFFFAEKDIWKVFKQVIKERRRRELVPVLEILTEVSTLDAAEMNTEEGKMFLQVVEDIKGVTQKADHAVESVLKADEKWFLKTLMKLLG